MEKAKIFSREYLYEEKGLPYDDTIEDEIVEQTRWSVIHEIVFEDNGKFYQTEYSTGATEYQDEYPSNMIRHIKDVADCWMLYKIIDIIKFIKRHFIIAYVVDFIDSQYHYHSYIKMYLSLKFSVAKSKLLDLWRDGKIVVWQGLKTWFIQKNNIVNSAWLENLSNDCVKCYPSYSMRIHFNLLYPEDKTKQTAEELALLEKWFPAQYYKNMRVSISRDGEKHLKWYC